MVHVSRDRSCHFNGNNTLMAPTIVSARLAVNSIGTDVSQRHERSFKDGQEGRERVGAPTTVLGSISQARVAAGRRAPRPTHESG